MLETTIKDIEAITMTMFNKKVKSENTKAVDGLTTHSAVQK